MSLINEALRKARFEAARQEAADSGMPYPSREGEHQRRDSSLPWLVAAVLGLVLIAGVGGLLFWLGHRSAGDGVQVVNRPAAEPTGATDPSPEGAVSAATKTVQESEPRPAAPPSKPTAEERRDPPATIQPTSPPESVSTTTKTETRAPVNRPRPAAAAVVETPRSAAPEPVTQAEPRPAPPPTKQEKPVPQPVITPRPEPELPTTAAATEEVEALQPLVVDQSEEPPAQDAPEERVFVGEAEVGGGVVRLEGIAWSRDRPFALINGRVVGPGDHVESLTITKVERRRILLQDDGGSTYVLQLP